MDKLKKCPFCSGESKVEERYREYRVYCTKCMTTGDFYYSEQAAIDQWNKRVGALVDCSKCKRRHGAA